MVRSSGWIFLMALWHLCITLAAPMVYKAESLFATIRYHRKMFAAGAFGFLVGTNLITTAALALSVAA